MSEKDGDNRADIFKLLLKASEQKKKERKAQLLEPIGVKVYFDEGSIRIDKRTCKGVECKLCIEACPTHALYWKSGEVGIVEDLCLYCAACVWNCIVDDCIRVSRKRPDGEVEEFSNIKDICVLMNKIIGKKRRDRVRSRLEWVRKI
jgi:NAD-dependent dihydropyrimidine dehydrogenase PreA subunit